MKKRILFSASLFHSLNDSATVVIPMIFPLLYSQQFAIKRYSHIGILSYLGFLITIIFQIIIANNAHKHEYKNMLFFSICGIGLSLFVMTLSWSFGSLLLFYLLFRAFTSFYHPIGIAIVSKNHPNRGLDFAMGIQSGSGNLGVLIAFVSVGYLAQNFGWKRPLIVWALISIGLGLMSYFSVRRFSSGSEEKVRIDFSSWLEALSDIKKYIFGFMFGGACWGITVYYAPSLFNHKYQVPLSKTGIYLALWIVIGTFVTYSFGFLSRVFGRKRISIVGFIGSSLFLFLLWISPVMEMAVGSLFFFGSFLFLIYPAFQSFVGSNVPFKNQVLAFSLVANIQMLSASVIVFVSGFLSDTFGINSPFLLLAVMGVAISIYYYLRK